VFSYQFYKTFHILGAFTVMAMLGGIALHVLNGGTRQSNAGRALTAALHGTALLVVLVAGFGMMARLNMMPQPMPGWIYVKIGVWLVLGAMGGVLYRKPALAKPLLMLLPLLGGLAAYMAVYKPL